MVITSPAPDLEQLKAALIWLSRTTETAKYCVAASTAWLLYDLIITFEEEVELIWRSRNQLPKFLYFTSRYLGLFTQLCLVSDFLPMYCASRFVFEAVACTLLSISVQLSLMIRVYALWGRSRAVGYALLFGFMMGETANVCMLYFGYRVILPGLAPLPNFLPFRGCMVTTFPRFYNLCWLPTLCFETFLFVMNAISCLRYRPLEGTPTIRRVFRDGSIYFASVFIILLLTTVGAYFPASGVPEYTESWFAAVFSLSGSHLLLSIRRLAAERQKHMEFSGVSTYFVSTQKPSSNQTESAAIELRRLRGRPAANAAYQPHAQERQNASSGTTVAGGDFDPERGRVQEPRSGSEAAPHELPLLTIPEEETGFTRDVEESPAESASLPPLAFEPKFESERVLARLARNWSLDWLMDWEH